MTVYPVRAYVGSTNHDPVLLFDMMRRLGDRVDIKAKAGQTDRRIRRKGCLRMVFRSRRAAMRFQRLVEEAGLIGCSTRRFRHVI